jgi:vacuolar protein sorting-associated protein 13A/C
MLWKTKSFKDSDHLFLLTEEGTDTLSLCDVASLEALPPAGGEIVVNVGSVVITMEAGFGTKTLPLIHIESRLYAHITDWTRQLQIRGGMSLQISYFNSRLALWEPLIEPKVAGDRYKINVLLDF